MELYLSLAEISGYATRNIGVYFSDTVFEVYANGLLNFPAQIESSMGVIYDDTINWMKISGEYIAHGGEEYLIIGNFKPDSLTVYDTMSSNMPAAYYFIDDVSLIDCTSVGMAEVLKADDIKLYPNPVKDILQLQAANYLHSNTLVLKNVFGQTIIKQKYSSEIDMKNLRDGLYFLEIETPKGVIVKKIVKM